MSTPEPQRQYFPIWEQIKQTGMCEISTHKAFHRRIIKAVIKEKYMDLGFKLECSESYPPIVTTMEIKKSASIIKFILHTKPLITLDSI
jgi:hypothetical protein